MSISQNHPAVTVNPDHRGRTAGGRTTFRPLVQPNENWFPPDSVYWHGRAMQVARELSDLVGYEQYCVFVDAHDFANWRELHDLVEKELASLAAVLVEDNLVSQSQNTTSEGHSI